MVSGVRWPAGKQRKKSYCPSLPSSPLPALHKTCPNQLPSKNGIQHAQQEVCRAAALCPAHLDQRLKFRRNVSARSRGESPQNHRGQGDPTRSAKSLALRWAHAVKKPAATPSNSHPRQTCTKLCILSPVTPQARPWETSRHAASPVVMWLGDFDKLYAYLIG